MLRTRILAVTTAALALAIAPLAATSASAAGETLTTTMSVDQEFAHSGSNLSYTLTVANSGPEAVENVTVTAHVPDALTVTGASNGGALMPPGDLLEWPAATIASGGTLTLTMTAQVNDGYTNTVVSNYFVVSAPAGITIAPTGPCAAQEQACAQTEIVSRDAAPEPPVLAATGSEPGIPALAAALLLAGGILLLARRRTVSGR